MREESGQKLVKELAGRYVPVVCDPTLLFTGEEWLSIQKDKPIVEDKYILCYFLGNNPPHREFAKRLREATGCKIIALTHLDEFVKSDEGYADETPYNVDPADFLNLIRMQLMYARILSIAQCFRCSIRRCFLHLEDTHGKRNLLRIVGWTHCFGLQGYQNAY